MFGIRSFFPMVLLVVSSTRILVGAEVDAQTGKECVDANEQCPHWASIGECEKNPEYMRGTYILPLAVFSQTYNIFQ